MAGDRVEIESDEVKGQRGIKRARHERNGRMGETKVQRSWWKRLLGGEMVLGVILRQPETTNGARRGNFTQKREGRDIRLSKREKDSWKGYCRRKGEGVIVKNQVAPAVRRKAVLKVL